MMIESMIPQPDLRSVERLRNNFWHLSTADPDLARDEMHFPLLDLFDVL